MCFAAYGQFYYYFYENTLKAQPTNTCTRTIWTLIWIKSQHSLFWPTVSIHIIKETSSFCSNQENFFILFVQRHIKPNKTVWYLILFNFLFYQSFIYYSIASKQICSFSYWYGPECILNWILCNCTFLENNFQTKS